MLAPVLKGVLLGLVSFSVFTVIYWVAWFGRPRMSRQIGLTAVQGVVTHNPYYWSIGILMVVVGCLIMLTWPTPVKP